jgi:stearoyl-CoA desaturase (delta-9 desaturase)
MGAELSVATSSRPQWAWSVIVVYIAIHLGGFAGMWVTGISVTAVLVFLAGLALRSFALTICYHRYFAHRAFKTSRAMQFVLALVAANILEGGILWWAHTHRQHHRDADTPDDIHSPRYRGFLHAHLGWFFDKRNRDTHLERVPDLARYPELVWIDRWYILPFVAFAVPFVLAFGAAGLVWGVVLPTLAIWEITHWMLSVSHCWRGYRRWNAPDDSRNHWWLGMLAFGEYHNNHHMFPSSARLGHVWWELDLGYQMLRVLAALGLVWDLKLPSALRGKTPHPLPMLLRSGPIRRLPPHHPRALDSVEATLDRVTTPATDSPQLPVDPCSS